MMGSNDELCLSEACIIIIGKMTTRVFTAVLRKEVDLFFSSLTFTGSYASRNTDRVRL
jgi:hypothetical protein